MGDTIRGFVVGDDLINLSPIFESGFEGEGNIERFTTFIRLIDDGLGNTEVRIDNDGSGPGERFVRLATLRGMSAASIDASSFVIGSL